MRRGFTLIEVMVVMTIAGLLLATTAQSLFQSQVRLNIDAAISRFIGEGREQQMRAMAGDTAPLNSYIDYSVRFETDRYILFPGNVYDEGNPANTTIILEAPLVFTDVTLPSSILSFSRSSGDARGFVSGQNSFTLTNSQTGQQRTLSVNRYGVFYEE